MLALLDSHRWNVMVAERIAPAEGWTGSRLGTVVNREESPTLEIGGRSSTVLASRSKNSASR